MDPRMRNDNSILRKFESGGYRALDSKACNPALYTNWATWPSLCCHVVPFLSRYRILLYFYMFSLSITYIDTVTSVFAFKIPVAMRTFLVVILVVALLGQTYADSKRKKLGKVLAAGALAAGAATLLSRGGLGGMRGGYGGMIAPGYGYGGVMPMYGGMRSYGYSYGGMPYGGSYGYAMRPVGYRSYGMVAPAMSYSYGVRAPSMYTRSYARPAMYTSYRTAMPRTYSYGSSHYCPSHHGPMTTGYGGRYESYDSYDNYDGYGDDGYGYIQ